MDQKTKQDMLDYFNIDIDTLNKSIENTTKIEDDEEFFLQMSAVTRIKKLLKDALEDVESIETDVKGLINSKAKAIYGPDWQTIAGERFKITRSKTGDLYIVNGKPNASFTKVKVSVDSKAVEEFIAKNDKLPAGIELNDQRGESLRITIK